MTPDAMPIIGPVPERPGFFIISGFSGHGFQHSPAAGRILADIITDRSPGEIDLAPFAFDRFARGNGVREGNVV
jgi:glycine/D-amino acid oxidase-like deaminating enzyme